MKLSDLLQALLRFYAKAFEIDGCEAETEERFRKELRLLISEYGPSAVEAALDDIPDNPSPPIAPR
jgi:thiamine pyrophosphate-dependent acetolactate synthase large subunit-like protein